MATVSHKVATPLTTNVASYASGSFTPTQGDFLVVFAVVTGTTTAAATCTASANGITFVRKNTGLKAASADRVYVFVAQQLVGASPVAMTVTVDTGADAGTGCVVEVAAVAGMSRVDSTATRQTTTQDNASAATTPTLTFGGVCLTGNPVLVFCSNGASPAALTPPASFTEQNDTGYSTPTTGAEYATRNSGHTSATVTWGAASATTYGAVGIELDASALVNQGTGAGTWANVGVATGARTSNGTGAATAATVGVANGKRTPKASGAGTWANVGTASGTAPAIVNDGTGAGTWANVGTATGTRTPKATATGTWANVGAATGKRTPKATGSGTWANVGVATGKRTPKATAAGTWANVGVAAGKRTPKASGVGSWSLAGVASGVAPAGVNDGTGSGIWANVGTATGSTVKRGTAIGSWANVGVAAGSRASRGAAFGSLQLTGAATGARAPLGTAAGAWQLTGAAFGETVLPITPRPTTGTTARPLGDTPQDDDGMTDRPFSGVTTH